MHDAGDKIVMARINSRYTPGTGDRGYTNYMSIREGNTIKSKIEDRKDGSICRVYHAAEEARLFLNRTLDIDCVVFASTGLQEHLKLIEMNMACYSGFAHYLGDSPKCVPPKDYIYKLIEGAEYYNAELSHSPDFVHETKSLAVWSLYYLNELIRKLETEYVAWMHHPRVIRNIYDWFIDRPEDVVELGQNIIYMSALLNRMSKFIDAAARHENMVLGLPESHWQAKAVG